ncbi:transposon Ty2-DR2 Gag-Pol polyprotein [Kluyveromyces marxianus]|uniref:Transposon Ty2-DR2 Gag-Pol polyprotein n=1 Tax=Kluyveromyces marxianus TaxID=4911 RepID=A0ABX6EXB1_KLUMA|nr:transposon Ty2-DR2 Gag-Pol polyprotein [Kluyveromyces marxianus]
MLSTEKTEITCPLS